MKLSEKIIRKYLKKKERLSSIIFYSVLIAPINAETRSKVLKEVALEEDAIVIYKDYSLLKKFGSKGDFTLRNFELLKPSKKKKYYTDGLNGYQIVVLRAMGYNILGGNAEKKGMVE